MRRFFVLVTLSSLLLLSLLIGPIGFAQYVSASSELGDQPQSEMRETITFLPAAVTPADYHGLSSFSALLPTVLTVTKQVSGPLIAGVPLTYSLTVTNTNLITNATNVVVTDTLPTDAIFVSADQGGLLFNTDTVSWTIPSIITASQVTVSFVVTTCQTSISNTQYQVMNTDEGFNSLPGEPVDTTLSAPTIEADFSASPNPVTVGESVSFTSMITTNGGNINSIAWDFGDTESDTGSTVNHAYSSIGSKNVTLTVTDNCGFSDLKTIPVSVVAPNLVVTKSAAPDPVQAGQALTYTIVVENNGLGLATGVTITDTVPANTTFQAGSISLVAPSGGAAGTTPPIVADGVTILAGERVTATFRVDVDTPLDAGDLITNVVSADNNQTADVSIVTETTTISTTPQIQVVKTGSPLVNFGQTAIYTFTVTNIGNTVLENIDIEDDVTGTPTLLSNGNADNFLDLAEAWIYVDSFSVNSLALADPLINTASVTGTDHLGSVTSDTDDHSVDINYNPAYEIDKDGPTTGDVDDSIQYTIMISNTGGDGSAIQNVVVNDPLLGGNLSRDSGDDGDNLLEVGEVWVYQDNRTIQPTDSDPLVNTATLNGDDLDGEALSQASDGHSINVNYNPAYEISKDGPTSGDVDDSIQYTIMISNTGGDGSAIQNVVVNDPLLGGNLSRDSGDDGDNLLEVGEVWVYQDNRTILATDSDPLLNTATLNGDDLDGESLSQASDGHSINVNYNPAYEISKDGPTSGDVDDSIQYTIMISNTGGDGSAIQNVVVNDPLLGGNLSRDSGDDGDDLLEVGEVWVYQDNRTIQPTDSDPLLNTATLNGDDLDGEALSQASDGHSINVNYNPAYEISKDGPTTGNVDDSIQYTITISNTGGDGSAIQNVVVNDPLLGGDLSRDSGDDGDDLLEVGEVWVYQDNRTIQPTDSDPLLNAATLNGDDLDGEALSQASDGHSINVNYNPAYEISKDGPTSGDVDDSIQYTITISNTGGDGSAIQNVVVNDPLLGGDLSRDSGDDGDNLLEVGEVWVYQDNRTIQPTDSDPLLNTATLNGDDLDGEALSQASDGHSINVNYNPAYEISKDGPTSGDVGDSIQYTIMISNTGGDGSAIQNVVVNNPLLGGNLNRDSGDDGDNLLEVGEVWVYQNNRTIQPTDSDPLVITATLNGDDLDGEALSQASDGHSINVNYNPAYEISKDGPTSGDVGDSIQYTITISNTGGDGSAIQNVVVNDPLLGGNLSRDSGDDGDNLLEAGEVWVYQDNRTIQPTDSDPLVNTATLNGDDLDGEALSQASDGHSINVNYNPVLTITKTGPAFATVGQDVFYTFSVSHDSSSDGSAIHTVVVNDDILDPVLGPPPIFLKNNGDNDNLLENGETWVFRNASPYVVPEDASDPLVNIATVTGKDLDNENVTPQNASHSMPVNFSAGIDFDKIGPDFASVGETIVFTFEVRTSGDNSSLSNVVVTDTLGIVVNSVGGTPNIGDANSNSKVDMGETWVYTASYTVPVDSGSFLVNQGVVTAKDGSNASVSATDSHFTTIQFNPRLTITKTGPVLALVNETILYTLTIEHDDATSDQSDVSSVTVTDTVNAVNRPTTFVGGDDSPDNGLLDYGETWVYTVAYTVQPSDIEPLLNLGEVIGRETNGALIPVATDTHSVQISYAPAITISVTGPSSASAGQSIAYTYDVQVDPTVGDGSPIRNISLTDTIAASVTFDSFLVGDNDQFLEMGEIWRYTAAYQVKPTDPNPLINLGTVQGEDLDGDPLTPASDDNETPITFAPILTVTKTGPDTALIDEDVFYTITVSHGSGTDESPITNVDVDDNLTNNETYLSGDSNDDDQLDFGETWTYVTTYTTSLSDPDPVINTVTVNGKNIDGLDLTAVDASHNIDLDYAPAFTLQSAVSEAGIAQVGQTLGYTYTISYDALNGDGSPISNVVVSDDIPGGVGTPTGDDGDNVLELGEIWVYNVTYIIQPDDSDPFENTVTLNGSDLDGEGLPQQQQSLSVPIEFTPDLTFVKTGPDSAVVGENVVYRFAISHSISSDDSSLNTLSVTDSLFGTATFSPNTDTNSNGQLDAGEIWEFLVQHTVTVADSDPMVNQGSLTGLDRDGDTVSLSSNIHSLDINFIPRFEITTMAPLGANVGETIALSYTVRHDTSLSDRSPIANVVVTNNIPGTATFVSGDTNNNSLLDYGEVWIFEASDVVSENVAFTHTGQVSGTDADGETVTPDSDSKTVIVGSPPILSISKSGKRTAFAGDVMIYTLVVTNSGLVPANNLVITDRLPSKVTYLDSGSMGNLVNGVVKWTLPLLNPDSNAVFTFSVKVLDSTTNDDYGVQADGNISKIGSPAVSTAVTHLMDLPTIVRIDVPRTQLSVFNDNTGADVTFEIRQLNGTLVFSCVVANNDTRLCGEFPSATYLVSVFSACGSIVNQPKTYTVGPDLERLFCISNRLTQ